MTTRAKFSQKSAFLFTEFGEKMARKWFGNSIVDSLPVYGPRSKHSGKPKGQIAWLKVESGGWVRSDRANGGYVERRVGSIVNKVLFIKEWNSNEVQIIAEQGDGFGKVHVDLETA